MKEKIKKVLDEKKLNEKTPKYGKRKLKIGLVSCLLAFTLSIPITFAKENKPAEVTHTITVTDELQKAKADALETLEDNGIKDNESISKINACNSIEQVRKTKKEIIKKHREENRKKQEKEEQERIKEEQRKKELEDVLAELATGDKGLKLKKDLGEEEYKKFYDNVKEKINDPKFTAQKAKSYLEKPELLKKDDELKEVKEKAKKELKENGIDTEFFLKRIDSASKKELVEELTKQIISSHKLQKAKEKLIKELDKYTYIFDESAHNGLANHLKEAKKKEIQNATTVEEVNKIEKQLQDANELSKVKKEAKTFLDRLTHVKGTEKTEITNKIGNAKDTKQAITLVKDELKKALDGYSDVFSEKLYPKDFVKALKTQEEQEIDKINSLEELNKKLDTIENANKIAKAKEEAKEKVKDMKELSFEEKTEAYNAIGSGSTLEEVNTEIKKAQEKESLKKEKANSLEKLDENGITDKESIDKINNATSVEQVKAIRKEIIKRHREENRKKQEKEEQERIKEEKRKKELEDLLAELATGDKGLELEKALGKEKIEKLFNEIKQGLNNPEYTKEKAKKELETLETKVNELKEVKKEAKEELRKEGITSKLFLDKIDLAKTKESVDALKTEIIKSHKEEVLKKALKEAKEKLKLSYEHANKFLETENGKYYVYPIQKLVNEAYDYVEEGKDITLEKANKLAEDIEDALKNVKELSTKEQREEAKQYVDLKNLPDKVKELAKKDIDNAITVDDVKDIVSRVDVMDRKLSEKSLKEAKEKAKEELRKEGITSKLFLDKIDLAKTKEGVDALKTEIIKSHKQEILNKAKEEAKQHVDLKNLPDKVKELAKRDIDNAITVDDVKDIVSRVDVMDRKVSEKSLKEAKEKLKLSYEHANKFLETENGKYYVYPIQKLVNEAYDYVEEGKDITLEKANKLAEDIEDALKNVKELSTKEQREEAKQYVDLKNLPDKVKELAKKDIDNAITVDDVKDIVSRVDVMDRKLSEKSLKEAKEKAKEELRKEGITSKLFLDKIDLAKTKEGVDALKTEIIKSHKEEVLKKTKELEALKAKLEALKAKLEALKTKLEELKAKKLKKSNSVDTFKSGYMMDRTPFMLFALSTSNENNVENLQNEINETKNQIKDLEKQIKDLEKQIEDLTKEDPAPVPNPNPVPNPMPNPNPAPNPAPEADKEAEKKAKELQETKEKAIAELKEASIEDKESIAKINACKSVEEVNKVKEDLLNEKKAKEIQEAKEKAIAELKEASIEDKESIAKINACKSVEEVNKVKENLLSEKKAKELQEAKEKAIAELKEASIEDEESIAKINACKSIEEVNEVKEDLLKQKKGIVVKKKKQNTPNTSIAGASLATTIVSLAGAIMIKRKRR